VLVSAAPSRPGLLNASRTVARTALSSSARLGLTLQLMNPGFHGGQRGATAEALSLTVGDPDRTDSRGAGELGSDTYFR
jgi:hypothetical protein